MKRNFILLALAALLLTGCSLARAEAAGETAGDRWCGFYVVPTQGYSSDFYDNPYLEEYGSFQADTGQFGTLSFPQEALFAVKDDAGNYSFPGLEDGFSLFCTNTVEDYGPVTSIISNMAPDDKTNSIVSTDSGTSYTISGTIYCGPPAGVTDWDPYQGGGTIWHFYLVYQTEDGRVYLTGDGNTTNGFGSMTNTATYSQSENGETVQEETISATVTLERAARLERLVVTQFDENNAIMQSEDLSLQNDRPEIHCLDNAAWVLVEEISPDGTDRALYDVSEGEDPVSHMFILLDENGYGSPAWLNIYAR